MIGLCRDCRSAPEEQGRESGEVDGKVKCHLLIKEVGLSRLV